jgi:amino acid permease
MLSVEGVKAGSHASDWKMFSLSPGWFLMIATVASAFDGHYNAPQVYQELKDRSPKRWASVTTWAFSICTLITLSCGVSGYLMFGSELGLPHRSNVLTAPLFKKKTAAMLAYIATTISVTLAFPIILQSFRNSLENILLNYTPSRLAQAFQKMSNNVRSDCLSTFCVALNLVTALSTDNLGLCIAVTGCVCCGLLCFVLPSLMYLRLTEKNPPINCLSRLLPWLSVGSGSALAIVGTTVSILLAGGVDIPAR